MDWQAFGDAVKGQGAVDAFNPEVQDGELAEEHFTYRKSTLNYLMDKCYFPEIDCQEHLNMFTQGDYAIKMEHEKLHDKILVELISLQ